MDRRSDRQEAGYRSPECPSGCAFTERLFGRLTRTAHPDVTPDLRRFRLRRKALRDGPEPWMGALDRSRRLGERCEVRGDALHEVTIALLGVDVTDRVVFAPERLRGSVGPPAALFVVWLRPLPSAICATRRRRRR